MTNVFVVQPIGDLRHATRTKHCAHEVEGLVAFHREWKWLCLHFNISSSGMLSTLLRVEVFLPLAPCGNPLMLDP